MHLRSCSLLPSPFSAALRILVGSLRLRLRRFTSFRASRIRSLVTAGLALVAFSVALPAATGPSYHGPVNAGKLEAPPKKEASGLAVSRRTSDLLWTHDDSGGDAALYAVDTQGRRRGTLRILGVENKDWEDLASFEKDGKAWLLIADTGDNDAKRDTVRLHVVEEPASTQLFPTEETHARPAYTIRLRYEDGSRDCEAVAVDATEGFVYLLTKRETPPRLYRVPLGAPREKTVTARFLAPIPTIIGQTELDAFVKHLVGKKFSWPTAMDFSADGRAAVVLTYGEPLVYTREAREAWTDAFKRSPTRLLFHGLPQAEAVCFSRDGKSIYIASEQTTALVRYDRE